MKTVKEYLNEEKSGTYVGVLFSSKTKEDIKKYIADNNIPNSINIAKLHTTLIYSRKNLPKFKAIGKLESPIIGKFDKFETWDTQDKKRALVMKFISPELKNRNKEITDIHGATSDYPEYKVHLTLSYDLGEISLDNLPVYTGVIEIVEEYQERLDLDWTNTHKK